MSSSQPDYPIFSKRYQRTHWLNKHPKTTKEAEAEEWFASRTGSVLEMPEIKKISVATQTITPIELCSNCGNTPHNKVMLKNCSHLFCLDCIINQRVLFNSCPKCHKVLNEKDEDDYGELDIKIPSYEDFDRPSMNKFDFTYRLQQIANTTLSPEETYSGPAIVEGELDEFKIPLVEFEEEQQVYYEPIPISHQYINQPISNAWIQNTITDYNALLIYSLYFSSLYNAFIQY